MNNPKVILMPIGTGGEAQKRLLSALSVASKLNAHLRVLHTNVSPQTLVPNEVFVMSGKALDSIQMAFDQHAGEETNRLKALFNEACNESSVPIVDDMHQPGPSASWLEVRGLRSSLVACYGKIADLTLLATPPEKKPTATFEAAVLETGRPLLLLPRSLQKFTLDNVMISWNCTAEASRSMFHALPLIQQAEQVTVVSTDRCAGCEPNPQAVADYLTTHGICATSEVLKTGRSYKGEALVDRARELNCKLLVMGAYSKKRLHESVFGGLTQYMVAEADMPLFLSH